MNLHELIERYIAYRQTLGEHFKTNASILRAFARAVGSDVAVTGVCLEQVESFLTGGGRPVTSAWHVKHTALFGFYRYALSRGHVTASPLPIVLPQRPPRFVPYIYTHQELRRLLDAIDTYQRHRSIMEPVTLRTVVLLLYGTGLRSREAVTLDRADVDLANLVLTVRHTKFDKTRLVPFSQPLGRALAEYVARPRTSGPAPEGTPPFFTTRRGSRVTQAALEKGFRRLCEHAGIRREDGARYQPRLHDLRHAFALNRLTSWYRQGADVQRLLPHLSVYLGHSYLVSTQVYLSMTPELLQQAGTRFESYACGEKHHD